MPVVERMDELLSYFEHTYVRGRRRPGRGVNYGPPLFAIATWTKRDAATDGMARMQWRDGTTDSRYCSNAAILPCGHSSLVFKLTSLNSMLSFCRELPVHSCRRRSGIGILMREFNGPLQRTASPMVLLTYGPWLSCLMHRDDANRNAFVSFAT
jgi:hypothetical protein